MFKPAAATHAPHSRSLQLRRFAAPAAGLVGLVVLIHEVDLPRAAATLRLVDGRWMLLAVALTILSMTVGAIVWGLYARAAGLCLSWAQVMSWSGRAIFFGQLVPGGAGGDAVRVVAGRSAGGLGPGLASDLVARICGSIGLTLWALAAALLLRDDVGMTVVWVAMGLAAGTWVSLAIVLDADRLVGFVEGRRSRLARTVAVRLHPLVDPLGGYRERPALIAQTLLMSCAGWGLNLAALVCLGHAVGVALGWQVFAVAIPCTLVATLTPISINGVGMREGILIGLLSHAGVVGGQAVALSVLVDVQLVPVALLGAAIGLFVPRHSAPVPTPVLELGVPVVGPVPAGVAVAVRLA